MIINQKDLELKAEVLFGKDRLAWEFKCSGCGNIQSGNSVIKQMKEGIKSQRYGLLKKGDRLNVECSCYSPDCNWTANGLFNSGILMIIDPEKPHDEALKKNCYYIFPFEDQSSRRTE
ncbi:hypothetical protein LCGC14_2752680 [marine sediment metagenome]|uniref:Uncharacterized protein n=1 Tax=marine sediment metagenome TaxID=412755 RepID=A0A0F9B9X4_9ZZZZ